MHLIATDPPFNKNRDFHATPDSLSAGARFQDRWSWDRDVHEEWVDAIKDDWPAAWAVIDWSRMTYGDDMAAFLCWLGVRLMEMHRVLRDDGSLYLHIDHTAHAYVKTLMDAIFGRKNFRNEIVWCYSGGGIPRRDFPRKHDSILRYTKSEAYTFNVERKEYGEHIKISGRRATSRGGTRSQNYNPAGTPVNDWWADIKPIINWSSERTGYPTQKPLALYERIVKASSNSGDMVLDPFAGCATTPVAAERLGRQWVGMDIWEGAADIVKQRLESERRMFASEQVRVITTPPVRTDDNDVAAPVLRIRLQRPTEAWQRLTHKQMFNVLAYCQSNAEGVVCAGCGRILEKEFMQLDHIMPRSDRGANDILNRILLCGPCNLRKGNSLTLAGLLKENRRHDWMKHAVRAQIARDDAELCALRVRDEFDTSECQSLINGIGLPI